MDGRGAMKLIGGHMKSVGEGYEIDGGGAMKWMWGGYEIDGGDL